MSMRNMKNHIGFIYIHDCHNYNNKEKICAVIGVNTSLFSFVSMLIAMNKTNMRRKIKNDKFDTE